MIRFVLSIVATALAFWLVTAILPDYLHYDGGFGGLLILAVIFGIVNGIVGPIIRLLALPVRVMTLGLVGFVINAGLLLLTAWIADLFEVNFVVGDFPPDLFRVDTLIAALIGAVVLTVVNAIVHAIVPD